MALPTYEDLMLPLLREYEAQGCAMAIKDLLPIMAERLKLTEDDLAERLPSGRQGVFHNRLHWAKMYLTKAGLLNSPARGQAEITSLGRSILAEGLERIDNTTLTRFPEFVEWKLGGTDDGTASDGQVAPKPTAPSLDTQATPEERIEAARKELEQGLRADLLDRVRTMHPGEFEELIVQLLLRMGYGKGAEEMAKALGGSGDGGIDGVVHQDPLGLDRVYIQAKRYAENNKVTSEQIRNFNGALDLVRAPKGLFVTASAFTKDARDQAQNATRQIVLIDGDELAALMVRYKTGTRTLATIEVQGLDEGFFSV